MATVDLRREYINSKTPLFFWIREVRSGEGLRVRVRGLGGLGLVGVGIKVGIEGGSLGSYIWVGRDAIKSRLHRRKDGNNLRETQLPCNAMVGHEELGIRNTGLIEEQRPLALSKEGKGNGNGKGKGNSKCNGKGKGKGKRKGR